LSTISSIKLTCVRWYVVVTTWPISTVSLLLIPPFFKILFYNSFDELLDLISPTLQRQDTFMRESIAPVERLLITLRYLGTGQSLVSLHYAFMIGQSTASNIIRETCCALWDILHDVVMKKPNKEEWMAIADVFAKTCNFPNCLGALDGKHIQIIKPKGSGSRFFNYKKYFSFILFAVSDANYCFTYIDIGSYGSSSDAAVFAHSEFGQMLQRDELDLPANTTLPGTADPMPFVFVGDEAFALAEHLMRPYSNRGLSVEKRVFNYRLTRARRVVECAFGILSNKWRILHRPINLKLENAISVVKASTDLLASRGSRHGGSVRDNFAAYFMSPEGELSWQLQAINNE
uniref:DDE Tnp4 domain-containing protein n=1 Tax=Leptobrachium leishanense TaxID=445787 RepID=A0A8C5MYM5_9ANUR